MEIIIIISFICWLANREGLTRWLLRKAYIPSLHTEEPEPIEETEEEPETIEETEKQPEPVTAPKPEEIAKSHILVRLELENKALIELNKRGIKNALTLIKAYSDNELLGIINNEL